MSTEKVIDLEKELRGAHEMLAFVLLTLGEPVVVPKETLQNGIPVGATIKVFEDVTTDTFVFSVEVDE